MTHFRSFCTHLFTWQFWVLCAVVFLITLLVQRYFKKEIITRTSSILFQITFYISLIVVPIVLTIPFWINGEHSSIGTFDDTWLMLVNHMAMKASSDSTLWNRTLAGGTDFVFLHIPYFSIATVYASFLSVWNEYSLITIINTMLTFLFCWKIQHKILGINRWLALLSSLFCALSQGFWSEGKWPDGHIAYGHAISLIPMVLYFFLCNFQSKWIYLIALSLGVLHSFGSVLPLHTTPFALMVLAIWMLIFFPKQWGRTILVLTVFLIPTIVTNWNYIMTTMYYLSETGRGDPAKMISWVKFLPFATHVYFFVVGLIGVTLFTLYRLKLLKEKEVQKMLGIGLCFFLVPTFSYIMQESRMMPAYRWSLLYWGNVFPFVMLSAFLGDRILKKSAQINPWVARTGQVVCYTLFAVLCLFWFLNDIGAVLKEGYLKGDWAVLTNNATLLSLKEKEKGKDPFRVLQFVDDTVTHFLSYYYGFESADGEANLIDKDTLNFWEYVSSDYHPNHIRVLTRNKKQLAEKAKLMKLQNVKYLFSKAPLQFEDYSLLSYTPGNPVVDEQCYQSVEEPKRFSASPAKTDAIMWGDLFHSFDIYWNDVKCIWKNRHYAPSLYVYQLDNTFSRIYFAGEVKTKPAGEEFSDPNTDQYLLDGNAIISGNLPGENSRETKLFSRKGSIKIEKYTQDSISFHVSNPLGEQFVIMSEPNNKFWKIFIGDTEQKYYQVNLAQTGFFVPKGESKVEYIYCPPRRASCKVAN